MSKIWENKKEITTEDMAVLLQELHADWAVREHDAARWADRWREPEVQTYAKAQAAAFRQLAGPMESRANAAKRGVIPLETWTRDEAMSYLMRLAAECETGKPTAFRQAEARAFRQAARTLAGHPVRPDTPAILYAYLISEEPLGISLQNIGFCDDTPETIDAAVRMLKRFYVNGSDCQSVLIRAAGRKFMAFCAGGGIPSVRDTNGTVLLHGTVLVMAADSDNTCGGLRYEDVAWLRKHTKHIYRHSSDKYEVDGDMLVLDGVDPV